MKKQIYSALLLLTYTSISSQELPEAYSFLTAPPPTQQLVTGRQSDSQKNIPEQPEPNIEYRYEEVLVFALQSILAAFHINPETWSQDQLYLKHYYSPPALKQITEQLFTGNGKGICDQPIMNQTAFDAIPREPASISAIGHKEWSVTLPLILSDNRTINTTVVVEAAPNTKKKMIINFFQTREAI